ncbi:MAG: hypothetical protein AUH85_01220 [Chloroflexi bacterium 13_1_40CM_4_68_4]|nr:MAG: hypothetical protein AUH85_01220 [Chloroflexi bacterium 13_1_40CM_4_68_4]
MIRIPSVTTGLVRNSTRYRFVFAAAGAVLALAILIAPRDPAVAGAAPDLAPLVAQGGVAFVLPHMWLAAPPPPLVANDRVDVLASAVDRTTGAVLAASDARVLLTQPDAVVLEVAPDDVAALAVARAHAYVLVLVLRPR